LLQKKPGKGTRKLGNGSGPVPISIWNRSLECKDFPFTI